MWTQIRGGGESNFRIIFADKPSLRVVRRLRLMLSPQIPLIFQGDHTVILEVDYPPCEGVLARFAEAVKYPIFNLDDPGGEVLR